ncbi:MAG: hypothetical protein KAJ42_14360 [Gemmatimonadetes bacterium]|nr:hypothetical protein [Gemmatimonadota bacterium]
MVCLCSLVAYHGGPCKCSNCSLLFAAVNRVSDPAVPHNRTDTSKRAAARVSLKRGSDRHRTLEYLAVARPKTFTREQLCQALGILNQSMCAILNVLDTNGWVVVAGEREASTGHDQHTYRWTGKAFTV